MSDLRYELWDADTANCSGVFRTLEEALDVVRAAVRRDGEETLDGLGLLEVALDGEMRLIAEERDLLPLIGARSAAR